MTKVQLLNDATPNQQHANSKTGTKATNPPTTRSTTIIQVNLHQPAPPVMNWRILLEQSFSARMPLLTATSIIELGRRCWSSPQQHYINTVSIPWKQDKNKHKANPVFVDSVDNGLGLSSDAMWCQHSVCFIKPGSQFQQTTGQWLGNW